MPKITIKEIDLTSGGSLNATSNIVYVPGLAEKLPTEGYEFGKPRLYTNLSDFQKDFGTKVPIIKNTTSDGLPAFESGKAYDPGFIYATELLRLGMPVLFDCLIGSTEVNAKITVGDINTKLTTIKAALLNRLEDQALRDKGLYNIKFISTGGYVDAAVNEYINTLAEDRGDCCAIQDIIYGTSYNNIMTDIRSNNFTNTGLKASKYSTAFTPWGSYKVPCIQNYIKETTSSANGKREYYRSVVELPASFAYLMAAANCFATGVNNWSAIAGASRGTIPYLQNLNEHYTEEQITSKSEPAQGLQTRDRVSINPIATINPFGDVIWGNRTLFNNVVNGNLTASSFLNIRNLVSDVKKTVFKAARQLTFEQNSAILWVKFKSLVKPTLDQMVTGAGLSGYELIKKVTKEKAKLVATVRLFAIEAVEDFDITIELADDTAAITE